MEASKTPVPFSPPRRIAASEDLFSPPRKVTAESLEQKLSSAPLDAAEAAYISSRVSHVNRIPESASPMVSPRSRSASLVNTSTAAVELNSAKEEIATLRAKAEERDHLQRNIQNLLQALRSSEDRHKEIIDDLNATIEAERFKSKILEEELTQIEKLYGTTKVDLLSPKIASPQSNVNIVPLSPGGQSQNLLQQIIEIEKENKSLKKRVAKQENLERFLTDIEAKISSIEAKLKIREVDIEPKFYKTPKETVLSSSDRLSRIRSSLDELHAESEIQRLLNNTLFLETELSKHKTISNTERGTRKILEESVKKMDKGEDFVLSVAELAKMREENDVVVDKIKNSFRTQLEKLSSIMNDKLLSLEKELREIQISSKKKFEADEKKFVEEYSEAIAAPPLVPNSPLVSPSLVHSSPTLLESPPVLLSKLMED